MKITDGKRTVEIQMMVWQGSGYSPDWSNDFFDAGLLPRDEDGIYTVGSVDYCIEMAKDWESEEEDNTVFVEDVEA